MYEFNMSLFDYLEDARQCFVYHYLCLRFLSFKSKRVTAVMPWLHVK